MKHLKNRLFLTFFFISHIFIIYEISTPYPSIQNNVIAPSSDNNEIIHTSEVYTQGIRDKIGLDDKETTGKGVTVALFDSGIYPTHPAFTNDGKINWSDRILRFYDAVEEESSSVPYDIDDHGTWVASILGGFCEDYKGVAPEVNFVMVQVTEEEDDKIYSTQDYFKEATNWILDHEEQYDIKIVSISFGVYLEIANTAQIEEMNSFADELTEEGILVVAAAGNYQAIGLDTNDRKISAPGSSKFAISVGAVTDEGNILANSAKGPTHEWITKPDICAPGYDIKGADSEEPPDNYQHGTGTSASTPFVSGLAALMLEEDDDLEPLEIKNILQITAHKTNSLELKDNTYGSGVIQGSAALNALKSPKEINEYAKLEVSLSEDEEVYCRRVSLEVNNYNFKLVPLDSARGELFLYDSEHDGFGNPILIARQYFDTGMSVVISETDDYFLALKLTEGKEGDFIIYVYFDHFLSIISVLTIFGVAVIFILNMHTRYQKPERPEEPKKQKERKESEEDERKKPKKAKPKEPPERVELDASDFFDL